jgi:phytoene synthase
MFALDSKLGEVVRTTSEPMLGKIRLAWWRERLLELDEGRVVAEPTLEALAEVVSTTEVTGAALTELVGGWEALLPPFPCDPDAPGLVATRGNYLFGYSASILGASRNDMERAGVAGAIWALVDSAKRVWDKGTGEYLLTTAREVCDVWEESVVPLSIRPLVMLGLLARRDLERWPRMEREASPGRAWLMIRHRLTGRL